MKGKQIAELNVNEEIKSKKLLVIAPDGVQVGELELKKALILAEELELDLVEVSPESKPPVARLMDYGKYKYELNQKARESRKKQVKINVKEIGKPTKIAKSITPTRIKPKIAGSISSAIIFFLQAIHL